MRQEEAQTACDMPLAVTVEGKRIRLCALRCSSRVRHGWMRGDLSHGATYMRRGPAAASEVLA